MYVSRELLFSVVLLSACVWVRANNQNQFCADMKRQNSVDIDQLMGMWFGIEIILHKPDAQHIVEYYDTCPVIYLSELQETTTIGSYPSGYGAAFGYDEYGRLQSGRSTTTERPTTTHEYYRNSMYGPHNVHGYRYHRHGEMRTLRLLWVESGSNIEYTLRFNTSKAGFWMSSGPQNGSMLEQKYDQFAGTVQVMKAVGNHLVLTFCHQLPGRQLFTLLLSRETHLTSKEIHGVHNLLTRRKLNTFNIRKVCNGASYQQSSLILVVTLVFSIMWQKFCTTSH